MKKILFIDNTAHHLFGQLHLLNAYRNAGFLVEALVPNDNNYYLKISDMGFTMHNIVIHGKGVNPFQEVYLILKFKKIFKQIKPDLICSFTIKPNLYAAIAARGLGIPVVAAVTGLGTAFMKNGFLNNLAVKLYKAAFKKIGCVFFHNQNDYKIFSKLGILRTNALSTVLPGSGVDISKFSYVAPLQNENVTFLYSGRFLGDKGIYELIEAFKLVKQKYKNVKLIFIGNFFPENPSAISEKQIQSWVDQEIIVYLGMLDNVQEVVAKADCVILPSYREGMPRSLLEASSVGRPIITVDSIGCRDVIEDGITGFMAKVRDVESLADAMMRFIELPFQSKQVMGINGRKKIEKEFDQKIVINQYLNVANVLLKLKSTE